MKMNLKEEEKKRNPYNYMELIEIFVFFQINI